MQRGLFFLGGLAGIGIALFALQQTSAQQPTKGPVIVPRNENDASIHEGQSNTNPPGYRQDIRSDIGRVFASFDWFGGLSSAMGSLVQQYEGDPTYLGYKSGQTRDYNSQRTDIVGRLYEGFKKLGGKNVTDTVKLGEACGNNPGDPYWVGYPRLGNTEFAPRYQRNHHEWDCFCRCGEKIECPVPGQYLHVNHGGTYQQNVACETCFGKERIRKHDKFVGTDHGTFPGYDARPNDSGYQQCLRESVESFATSGGGGPVQGDTEVYGL